MERELYVTDLGKLLGGWTVNVVGTELSEHSRLLCAHGSRSSGFSSDRVIRASPEDHDRWCSATHRLLVEIRALQEREEAASLHLRAPFRGGLWWRIRYARRNWLLRRGYDEASVQLRSDFDTALAAYRNCTGDLPEYLKEFAELEKERKRREEEQARQKRAEAIADASGTVWSYEISKYSGGRSFWIYLRNLDDGGSGEHTAQEVHAALTAERAEHRYTRVRWGQETKRALEEKYKTAVSGWARLTGEIIIPDPHDPSKPPIWSKYHGGPTSNYGSF
ncbi:hypothetical protein IU486_17450 [Streptomyces gardneri]|uniref:hypothetical protein n=1 Tax=Nocardia TaxID=1817 RepID=UPI00135C385D|nr:MULTISPECIES: hypothetical protein [Nocardia]MBF6166522.1 hypothetical protein [Streptomyces gardneri]MBF6208984.1 hypothetical protein [Streptomyces gardneri]